MNSSRTSCGSFPLSKQYGTGAYLAGVAVHAEKVAGSFSKAVYGTGAYLAGVAVHAEIVTSPFITVVRYWCLPRRSCCPR